MELEFEKTNINPKGKKAGDCVIRAIGIGRVLTHQLDISTAWDQTYKDLSIFGFEIKEIPNTKPCYEKFLKKTGWIKQKAPCKYGRTKYTISEFVESNEYNGETIIIKVQGHLTAVSDWVLYDSWNCSEYKMGNYWIYNKLID